MSLVAPILQGFFTDRLQAQRNASPHTITAYRDTLKLLLIFASDRCDKPVSQLDLDDLGPSVITAFLDHLEHQRGNSISTRNARLAAIRSLFRYAALHYPDRAATIQQVLAIPPKRGERTLVTYLTDPEVEALLAAPERATWTGRRDHALLVLAVQTGLRISELISTTNQDIHLGTAPHVACRGKGRKQRITPLTRRTAGVLRTWLRERGGHPADPLFPTRTGTPLSRDAVERRLRVHTQTALAACPTLATKKVTTHTLRHTAAMRLLHAGVDTTVIALWLGHEKVDTTAIYIYADMTIKERALARTKDPTTKPGRYRPPDSLLAYLESL